MKETTPMSVMDTPMESLPELAKAAFNRPEKAHWTTTSIILGRIQDAALYGTDLFGKFATLDAYAKDQLDLTKGEVATALNLWGLMKRCHPTIGWERWASVKRARALLLLEVLKVGGDVTEWFTKMLACASTADFEQEVRKRLGEEVWVTLVFRVPMETSGMVEEALQRAVEAEGIVDEGPDDDQGEPLTAAEIASSRKTRHLCLEALARHYLQTVESPQLKLPVDVKE